jgi:acetyl-CoA acyltransferase
MLEHASIKKLIGGGNNNERSSNCCNGQISHRKGAKRCARFTRPDDIGVDVIKGILAKVPTFNPALIDDVIIGCAMPEAEQGYNIARIISTSAGIPESVPAQTVNRFCSSGLQTIAIGANAIMAGQADIILAGGVESMSAVPMAARDLPRITIQ